MKKSDLRTGMLVENRKGKRGIVLLETGHYRSEDVIAGNGDDPNTTWSPLNSFKEDLTWWSENSKLHDIVKVYSFSTNMHGINIGLKGRTLLWEREGIQEISTQEAEKRLSELMGKKIKIKIERGL
jgi:hypothetical protein